uniref:Protein RIC1 homolog n=1 Tax=Angiostrongylus cantonensis TaxID=6313 RepID=A0A0K0D349_ANGCA
LSQPIMVASFVEKVWHYRAVTEKEPYGVPHLLNALWINCGSRGMRVWLPLISARRAIVSQDTSFISKRIMLPFELDICPIVICSNDCLAVGVESLPFVSYNGSKRSAAVYTLHRNSEVFAHHILRQLLKRNLGVFALEVAAACRQLPHFAHSLELLLHGVLEEEATSSEPIPDPLLPRCVAFIQEFPEFLRTVAHCARKTELALWSSLFSVTGSPNDLFEVCLRDGQLQTATSYLIVLQNIESAQTSQEQALRLLREALSAGEWGIAKDMVRFTRAIGSEDMETPARTSPPLKTSRRHATSINSVAEADDLLRFGGGRITKIRHSHADSRDIYRKDSTGSTKRIARHTSNELSPPSPTQTSPIADKMDAILDSHGVYLLENYYVRDLDSVSLVTGFFISALNLDISRILSPSSKRHIEDFSLALTRLHNQFAWPYPIANKKLVDQLEKRFGNMRYSQSSASLNGGPLTDLNKSVNHLSSVAFIKSEKTEMKLCVVSRDVVRLRREINADSVRKAGVDAFEHTMFGCKELIRWATQNW